MIRFITQTLPEGGKSLLCLTKALVRGGMAGAQTERLRWEEARLRKALSPLVPGGEQMALWPSRSKTDTGRWWRPARLWLGEWQDQWYILAPGPRPYCQPLSAEEVRGACYNHVTGQLVFCQTKAGKTFSLKLEPERAYRLLNLIQSRKEPTYA